MQDFDQEFEVIRQKRVKAMTKMPTAQAYQTPMPGKGPDYSLVEGAFKKEDLSTRKVFDVREAWDLFDIAQVGPDGRVQGLPSVPAE